jgi:SAM-dependent methyltransferase
MRDLTIAARWEGPRAGVLAPGRRLQTREHLVVEENASTGRRLKYFSTAADVAYWTELWRRSGEVSYVREQRGHMAHQLRATFRRWVAPGARTLEAGCGLGHFTVAADALGYRAEGLDWSAATIQLLRRRFPSIRWHVGDARQLDFADRSFDAVYSPGVCEHFEEGPTGILLETRRVLRTGGVAVVSAPCFNAWLQRRTAGLTPDTPPAGTTFHQYAFTPEGMARLLGGLGFEVLRIHPYAALHTLLRYGGWSVSRRVTGVLAYAMDHLPVVRHLGSTCLWVARKC